MMPFSVLIFMPFRSGIEVGAGAFYSHTIVNCLDKDLPAIPVPAVHRVLRDELQFDA